MNKYLLLLLLFFLPVVTGIGQAVISTDYKNLNHSIADQLSIYEDPSGQATIDDILHGYYNYAGKKNSP